MAVVAEAPSSVEPFDFSNVGGFAQVHGDVQLCLHRLASHFTNQQAKSNWLVHSGLARVDREMRRLGDAQADFRESTQQRSYLLEDAFREAAQLRQSETIRAEARVREQEARAVDVLVPLVQARVSRTIQDLREALGNTDRRIEAQERTTRLTPKSIPESARQKLGADIAARLVLALRSPSPEGDAAQSFYDESGNLSDESAFVARLEADLNGVLDCFLPPAEGVEPGAMTSLPCGTQECA